MQNDKVAYAFKLVDTLAVVLFSHRFSETVCREQLEQAIQPGLDQVNTRGFQRFQESAGESERDTIAIPELEAPSRRESQYPGLCEWLAVEILEQNLDRLIVRQVVAAEHMAVSRAMLQRYAPLPTGSLRRGTGVGCERVDGFAVHDGRPVAGQPVGPVLVAGLQCLLDQQPAESGAVDE